MDKETVRQVVYDLIDRHTVENLSIMDISGEEWPKGTVSVNLILTGSSKIESEAEFKTL